MNEHLVELGSDCLSLALISTLFLVASHVDRLPSLGVGRESAVCHRSGGLRPWLLHSLDSSEWRVHPMRVTLIPNLFVTEHNQVIILKSILLSVVSSSCQGWWTPTSTRLSTAMQAQPWTCPCYSGSTRTPSQWRPATKTWRSPATSTPMSWWAVWAKLTNL